MGGGGVYGAGAWFVRARIKGRSHTRLPTPSLYSLHTHLPPASLYSLHTHHPPESLYSLHTHLPPPILYSLHTHHPPASSCSLPTHLPSHSLHTQLTHSLNPKPISHPPAYKPTSRSSFVRGCVGLGEGGAWGYGAACLTDGGEEEEDGKINNENERERRKM